MKTLTDYKIPTYTIPNLKFAVYGKDTFEIKCITVHIAIEDSFEYMVNGQIHIVDWFKSMLSNKVVMRADETINFIDPISILRVEDTSIDYIVLTLFQIIKKLNKDETIKFHFIQYIEHD
jgi:hypothetical protein